MATTTQEKKNLNLSLFCVFLMSVDYRFRVKFVRLYYLLALAIKW